LEWAFSPRPFTLPSRAVFSSWFSSPPHRWADDSRSPFPLISPELESWFRYFFFFFSHLACPRKPTQPGRSVFLLSSVFVPFLGETGAALCQYLPPFFFHCHTSVPTPFGGFCPSVKLPPLQVLGTLFFPFFRSFLPTFPLKPCSNPLSN